MTLPQVSTDAKTTWLDGLPLPAAQNSAAEYKVIDWSAAAQSLFNILFPLLRNAALEGAQTALDGLLDVGVGVSWELVNEAVVNWARAYTGNLITGINGTSQRFVQARVSEWIASGEPLDALEQSLRPMFGKVRSEMIAVTETTNAFAQGNLATWRESGVVDGKRWQTAVDDRVCPICQPLQGMEVGLDENGFTTEAGGIGLEAPPAHVRCRCWLQPVVNT